jgi:hypothetical protein
MPSAYFPRGKFADSAWIPQRSRARDPNPYPYLRTKNKPEATRLGRGRRQAVVLSTTDRDLETFG